MGPLPDERLAEAAVAGGPAAAVVDAHGDGSGHRPGERDGSGGGGAHGASRRGDVEATVPGAIRPSGSRKAPHDRPVRRTQETDRRRGGRRSPGGPGDGRAGSDAGDERRDENDEKGAGDPGHATSQGGRVDDRQGAPGQGGGSRRASR